MFKLLSVTKKTLFIIPLTVAMLFAQTVDAKLYKYRDERGTVRYSENPPANVEATPATPSEIVNNIQSKDLCAVPDKTADLPDKSTDIKKN